VIRAARWIVFVIILEVAFVAKPSAGLADGPLAPRVRVELGAGLVNGYQYLPDEHLEEIGIDLRFGFGQAGLLMSRGAVRIGRRSWVGGELLAMRFDMGLTVDDGNPGLLRFRSRADLAYVGPTYELEIARSDTLGWRITVSAGTGLALQNWRETRWRGINVMGDQRRTTAALGGSVGIAGLRRIGANWGLALRAGSVISTQFVNALPGSVSEDHSGMRQVYALAGIYIDRR
jgi:hypothetical protein